MTNPSTNSESARFARRLADQCRHLATQYGYPESDLGHGFESWVAHLFVRETGFNEILEGQESHDVDLSEYIVRRHDLGVDVVLDNPNEKQIVIVQAKWLGKNRSVDHQALESFLGIHNRIAKRDYLATGGDHIRELLGDYSEKIRDGYSVTLRFVTNKSAGTSARRVATILAANESYAANGHRVTCEFYSQTELKELEKQLDSSDYGILGSIQFSVKNNEVVEFDEPRHSIICRISGNELTNMYRQHKQSLFTFNIRYPMSLRRAINREIAETAGSHPNEFFFYNNGVSAVCSEFHYDKQKNVVQAERFQIINGAQTVGAIAGTEDTSAVSVLFRLTETNELTGGDFTDNVIRYNNTQNSVEVSDFRANDAVQKFLVEEIKKISGKGPVPHVNYVPKRGSKPQGRGGRTLKPAEVAGLRHALLFGPIVSYREPKSLFNPAEQGHYWEAFGSHGHGPVSDWGPEEIWELAFALALDDYIKKLAKELKTRPNPPEYTRFLYRFSRYLVALVAAVLRSQAEGSVDWVALVADSANFRDAIRVPFRSAIQLVSAEMTRRQNARAVGRPDYSFLRDMSTWQTLRESVISDVMVDASFDLLP